MVVRLGGYAVMRLSFARSSFRSTVRKQAFDCSRLIGTLYGDYFYCYTTHNLQFITHNSYPITHTPETVIRNTETIRIKRRRLTSHILYPDCLLYVACSNDVSALSYDTAKRCTSHGHDVYNLFNIIRCPVPSLHWQPS